MDMEQATRQALRLATGTQKVSYNEPPRTLVEDSVATMRRASAEIERLRDALALAHQCNDGLRQERDAALRRELRAKRELAILHEKLDDEQRENFAHDPRRGADGPEIDRLHDNALRVGG